MKAVLFDLDGTLIDPFEGITRCIRYALTRLEEESPSLEELARFIGPPLQDSFSELLPNPDEARIQQALELYRERFATDGVYENELYSGIPELLTSISERGWRIYTATTKPTFYARQIIERYSLDRFFNEVYGSELDGTRARKGELIEYILHRESIESADAVMVGDRWHDVHGAKANNVPSIGVTYGYGSCDELRDAGASWICDEPASVFEVLASYFA